MELEVFPLEWGINQPEPQTYAQTTVYKKSHQTSQIILPLRGAALILHSLFWSIITISRFTSA
jgi:hypothetical protein